MDSRIRSLYIHHVAMFILALGSSIIYTGLQPYLQRLDPAATLTMYGFVVAADALGQMVFSPLFGLLADRLGKVRPVNLLCAGTFIAGNAMFSLISLVPRDAWDLDQPRTWSLFVVRFIVGIGTAINASARAYISKVTTVRERTHHTALFSLFQTLGFVIGPAVQAALTPIGDSEIDAESTVVLNMYTATGWVSTLNGVVIFILFLPGIFVEHENPGEATDPDPQPKDAQNGLEDMSKERRRSHVVPIVPKEVLMLRENGRVTAQKPRQLMKQFSTISVIDGKNYAVDKKTDEEKKRNQLESPLPAPRPDLLACSISVWCFFSFFVTFVLMETLVTPIAKDNFGWSNKDAILYLGILLASGGVLSLFCFGSIGPLSKRLDERLLLIFIGIIPLIISRLFMMPMGSDNPPFIGNYTGCGYPDPALPYAAPGEGGGCIHCWCLELRRVTEVQFIIGFTIGICAYPYCVAIIGSLYSKLLGPKPQGLYMGVLTGSGSLARVIGPIFFTRLYQEQGTYVTMSVVAGCLVISLLLFIFTYKRFVPLKDPNAEEPELPAVVNASVKERKASHVLEAPEPEPTFERRMSETLQHAPIDS